MITKRPMVSAIPMKPGIVRTVFLDTNFNGQFDPAESSQATDADGHFRFEDVVAGTAAVRLTEQAPWLTRFPAAGFHMVELQSNDSVQVEFALHDQNRPPVANAGGDYSIEERAPLTLDASLSADPDSSLFGDFLTGAEWDLDNDGNFDDANGIVTTIEFAHLEQLGLRVADRGFQTPSNPVAVRVHDRFGKTDVDHALLTIYPQARVTGLVWEDFDANGVSDVSEAGMAGRLVFVDANENGVRDNDEAAAVTDENGIYGLDLEMGRHSIVMVNPDGWQSTTESPLVVEIGPSQLLENINFGSRPSVVNGKVYGDRNRNGEHDSSEVGLAGWTVELDLQDDGSVDVSTTTDAQGRYGFGDVPVGIHRVVVVPQTGFVLTVPEAGETTVEITRGKVAEPVSFGAFRQPDLLASGITFFEPAELLAGTLQVQYELGYQGDVEFEFNATVELWLSDDGELGGGEGSWEQLVYKTDRAEIGTQRASFEMPTLQSVGTLSPNTITSRAIVDGIQLHLVVVPLEGESRTDNNQLAQQIPWNLPDLVVRDLGGNIGFDPLHCPDAECSDHREVILPNELSVSVTNEGADLTEQHGWNVRLVLGTGEDIVEENDLRLGIWNVVVADSNVRLDMPFLSTHLIALEPAQRRIELPDEIHVTDLRWKVLVDKPVGETEFEPGHVPEIHEVFTPGRSNNVFIQPALQPTRVFDQTFDQQLLGDTISTSFSGRYFAYTQVDATGEHVFVRDRDVDGDWIFDEEGATATLQLDVSPSGASANAQSGEPVISSDGRFVAFTSWASNLVDDDFNQVSDVFIHELGDRWNDPLNFGITTRLSVPSRIEGADHEGNGASSRPSISSDGQSVAFVSQSDNFVWGKNLTLLDPNDDSRGPMAGDNNGMTDVFISQLADPGSRSIRVPIHERVAIHGADETFAWPETPGPATQVNGDSSLTAFFTNQGAGTFDENLALLEPGDPVRFEIQYQSRSATGFDLVVPKIPGIKIQSIDDSWNRFDLENGILRVPPPSRPGASPGTGARLIFHGIVDPALLDDQKLHAEVFNVSIEVRGNTGPNPSPVQLQLRVNKRQPAPSAGMPKISASGGRVVVAVDGHSDPRLNGIYGFDSPEKAAFQIAPTNVRTEGPVLSGDGRFVAFANWTGDNPPEYEFLRVDIDQAKSDGIELGENAWQIHPDGVSAVLSHDGTQVLHQLPRPEGLPESLTTTWTSDFTASLPILKPVAELQTAFVTHRDASGNPIYGMVPFEISGSGAWGFVSTSDQLDGQSSSVGPDVFASYIPASVVTTVTGTVFRDLNRNETREESEVGLASWPVEIVDQRSQNKIVVRTDEQGVFRVELARERTYEVRTSPRDGWIQTTPKAIGFNQPGATSLNIAQGDRSLTLKPLGVYPAPDLTPSSLAVMNEALDNRLVFGHPATLTYRTEESGIGDIQPDDHWIERIFLVDDGRVDGVGLERELTPTNVDLAFTGPQGVGSREVAIKIPDLTNKPSTLTLSRNQVASGLQLVVEVDPVGMSTEDVARQGNVIEANDGNNQADLDLSWQLPDVAIGRFERPQFEEDAALEVSFELVNGNDNSRLEDGFASDGESAFNVSLYLSDVENVADQGPGDFVHPIESRRVSELGELNFQFHTPELPSGLDIDGLYWTVLVDWREGADSLGNVLESHELHSTDSDLVNVFQFPVANIDLRPLEFEVYSGQLAYSGSANRFEIEGSIGLGFAVDGDAEFEPLLRLDGSFWFNQHSLHLDGSVHAMIADLEVPIFVGTLDIAVGDRRSQQLSEKIDSVAFQLGGLELNLASLELDPAGQILLSGNVGLPSEFGGFELELGGSVVLSRDGIELESASIAVPAEKRFSFLGLTEVVVSNLALTYESGSDAFIAQGRLELPDLFGVTADFAGDNYIRFSSEGIDVVGEITASDIEIVRNLWEIEEVKLRVETEPQWRLFGEGSMLIPSGVVVGGSFEVLNGELNFVELEASKLGKPAGTGIAIGGTGAFLQSIRGRVDHLASTDPEPLSFGGGVTITAGPKLNVSLPAWAGGGFSGAAVELSVDADIDENHLTAEGSISVVGGLIEGTGNTELNWNEGFLTASGDLNALGGLIAFSPSFYMDSRVNLTMSAAASVTLPEVIPVIGGHQLGSATAYVQYRKDASRTNDYIAGWGSLDLPAIGKTTAGIRIDFDGNWETLGAEEIAQVANDGLSTPAFAFAPSFSANNAQVGDSGSFQYSVAEETPWILVSAQWVEPSDSVQFEAEFNGTTLTESDFLTMDALAIVPDLSNRNQRTLAIKAPEPGLWTFSVASSGELGTVSMETLGGIIDSAPRIHLKGLDERVEPNQFHEVRLGYSAEDTDSNASVAFYLDRDQVGYDGILISEGHEESDEGYMNWSTLDLPPGKYFVYGVAMDQNNAPVFSDYSNGYIYVQGSSPKLLAPLPEIQVQEDSRDIAIDLSTHFFDLDHVETGETLTYSVVSNSNPELIHVELDQSTLQLGLNQDQHGHAKLVLRVVDAAGQSVDASLVVEVLPVNDLPVGLSDEYQVSRGGRLIVGDEKGSNWNPADNGVLANDLDIDGPQFVATLVTGPKHASEFHLRDDGTFEYQHNGRADNTTDMFIYRIFDGAGSSDEIAVTLNVLRGTPPYQNSDNPFDVNDDGVVSPLDALLVINSLDRGLAGFDALQLGWFLDTNGDDSISPLDALRVINALGANQSRLV